MAAAVTGATSALRPARSAISSMHSIVMRGIHVHHHEPEVSELRRIGHEGVVQPGGFTLGRDARPGLGGA